MILDHAAVAEADEAARMAAHIGVVRHEHDGHALAVQLLEQAQDLGRGAAVEGAGGLVGEEQARAVHERAGDRDALLLAAGELHRPVMGAVREADAAERLQGALAAGPAVEARIDHRQFDIAEGVDARQQVELLEHEADLAVAQARQAVGVEALDRRAGEPVVAAGRPIEAADQVHEGGLARAGRPHDGDEIARLDVERHAVERHDAAGVEVVDPAEIARFDESHRRVP